MGRKMYVYRWNDGLVVGHVDAEGIWHTDSYPGEPREAMQRVRELNRADRVAGRVTGVTGIVIEPNDDGFYSLGWSFPGGRWHPIFDVGTREEGEPWRLWPAGDDVPEPST
jgi:hypothetical protein